MGLKKYIGDKAFYRRLLSVAIPIMIQNGVTQLVSLVDNVMVGTLGTESMSGVSIVNQFVFVFTVLIFGTASAAGIFTAQYHGNGDTEGIRHTFRFKLIINLLAGVIGVLVFIFFGDALINSFIHSGSDTGDPALTFAEGKRYLLIMVFTLVPYAFGQVYATTMRETGQVFIPMLASVAAVFTNVVLNYVLIFGKLGFSPMGVEGAAWATVAARVVEMVIVVLWAHLHRGKFSYLKGAYRSFYIPARLCAQIASKGMPLMLNELFWALGMTVRNQCYSTRGIDVVAGLNIASTVVNLFSVVYMAVGHSMAVLIGNTLGAGKLDEARDGANKMLAFSVLSAASMGFLMLCGAGAFPYMYNTSSGVRDIASYMLVVSAFTMPFVAFAYSVYFVLRAGGRVVMTVMLDSGYVWAIVIPVSVILSYFTAVDIRILYPLAQASEAIKFIFAIYLLKKGTWVRRLVADKN